MKETNRLVLAGTAAKPLLRHGGNLVLRWMADNLRAAVDPAGNVKPDKAKSMDKIDGMSALITGLAVAMGAEAETESVYERRDVLVL
jgi:phage terminase large subunit-like protein